MPQRDDVPGSEQLDYEAWRETLRSLCGRYNPGGIAPSVFSGWVRPLDLWGLKALNIGSNAAKVERTHRDAQLDSVDHYFVLFQVCGQAALKHNNQAVRLSVGDVVLIDAAKAATYLPDEGSGSWNNVALNLPRAALESSLGFVPHGGNFRRAGTPAGRLLLDLILNTEASAAPPLAQADSYMQLAIYDLVGALFAPTGHASSSHRTARLFERMRALAMKRIEDPDFGPVELAAAAGISLRYAQKLFTSRGLTCSGFIYTLRMEHAARLLQRRASLGTSLPLSEIAYACGFRDYSHFARRFRRQFGYPPGAHIDLDEASRDRAVSRNADGSLIVSASVRSGRRP